MPLVKSSTHQYTHDIMKKLLLLATATPLLFSSCAQQSHTGDTYSRAEVGRAQTVKSGKITSIRHVVIQGDTQAGTILGGVGGALLGREIGSGRAAHTAGGIGGALAGAAIGSHAQKAVGTRQGIQITVKLNNGRSLSVTQEKNPREAFHVGDRVNIHQNGYKTRVSHR